MTSASLRLRLTLIILVPLLVIAAAIGVWQVNDAREKASDVFDRSLLSTALAVAADVALSNGDALSIETQDRLVDTSGGRVFYHVYAPDGVFVTGFATPPVATGGQRTPDAETAFFDGVYHGRDVRVLRLQNVTTIDGYSGVFTFTVWQDVSVREAFLRDLSLRTFIVISVLTGTVALVVWFGVNIGLRPLLDLEDAISARSSTDLRPIRRRVPVETRGLVTRLNSLFAQVETAMRAQNEFISNAAHQLRNPIAGVLAMAEAVESAPTPDEAKRRAGEVLTSARHAKDLANKLLTLERVQAQAAEQNATRLDVNALVREVADGFRGPGACTEVAISARTSPGAVTVIADEVMLREAVVNLVDNALRHGGPDLSSVSLTVKRQADEVEIVVTDDGVGLRPEDVDVALARFGQAGPSEGSGLGLSIADAIAALHRGRLTLETTGPGLCVRLSLPTVQPAQDAPHKALPSRQSQSENAGPAIV